MPSDKVLSHLAAIDHARARAGLSGAKVSYPMLLAFIHVESAGNPAARKIHVDSEFYGLLQMGRMAGLDVGFDDRGKRTSAMLHGDADMAIDAFLAYQKRYEDRHDWQPTRMAVVWKGGPGTAKTFNALRAAGVPFDSALAQAEERHSIHNLQEYLRRYREALQEYAAWHDRAAADGELMCKMREQGGQA